MKLPFCSSKYFQNIIEQNKKNIGQRDNETTVL